MAEIGIDTSSYPKPQQTNPLDTVAKVQGIESNKIGIDQQKLKLMNERYGILNKELSTLIGNPNTNQEDIIKSSQNLVKLGLIPADMHAKFITQVPTQSMIKDNPNAIKNYLEKVQTRIMSTQEAVNFHYGQNADKDTGQQIQPGLQSPKFGFKAIGAPFQKQIPPTQEVLGENGAPTLQGPTAPIAPPGISALPGGMPNNPLPVRTMPTITAPTPISRSTISGTPLPVAAPPAVATPAETIANRFPAPSGPATGFAPGVVDAAKVTGAASGEQLAHDRQSAATFQREIYPLMQAIPALEKLGDKGTGPGTETINHVKSFILSTIPGITKDTPGFRDIKTFDEAKKYLVDVVNQTGSTGTNDKLAATFAGNPSVNISNAASYDVAKSILALRFMKQAVIQEFENTGLRPDQYSKWAAKRSQELDPRAFGVNMMSDDAKKKLFKQLNESKNPKEKANFEKSLELAHNLGFVTPNGH